MRHKTMFGIAFSSFLICVLSRYAFTGGVVLLEYVLNVVNDEFPRRGLESTLANFYVLQRQVLADQRSGIGSSARLRTRRSNASSICASGQ